MGKAGQLIPASTVALVVPMVWAAPAWAGDSAGFYYGTDSANPLITTSGPIYINAFRDSEVPYETQRGPL